MTDPKMQYPEKLHQDRLDADAITAAVNVMVRRLRLLTENDPRREVRKLTTAELRVVAIDCISGYIIRRSQQRTLAELDDLFATEQSILQ